MPKLTYSVKLANRRNISNTQNHASSLLFGNRIKTSVGTSLYSFENNYDLYDNGFLESSTLQTSNTAVMFDNSKIVVNEACVSATLNGISALPVDVYQNRLACDLLPNMQNAFAYIYKNKNNNISIYKEYVPSTLELQNSFIVKDNKVLFSHENPISFCQMEGGALSFDIYSLNLASSEFDAFIDHSNITLNEFLSYSESFTLSKLSVTTLNDKKEYYCLNLKYFPVFPSISVLAINTADINVQRLNCSQVYVNQNKHIAPHLGQVFIDKSQIPENTVSVSVFYSVIPQLINKPLYESFNLKELGRPGSKLDFISIDNTIKDRSFKTDKDNVNLSATISPNIGEAVLVCAGSEFSFININSTFPIYVNDALCNPESGLYFINRKNNFLTFKSPKEISHLLTQIVLPRGDSAFSYEGSPFTFNTGISAVFGCFESYGVKRYSLMNLILLKEELASAISFINDSVLGVSKDYLKTNKTSLISSSLDSERSVSSLGTITVNVVPEKDGFQFILPIWAKNETIQINVNDIEFNDWKYIEPDIVVFDKLKTDKTCQYKITYQAAVDPVCPSLNAINKTIESGLLISPSEEYVSFKGFYLLSGKQFDVNFSFISKSGEITYLPNPLLVSISIQEDFLIQTINSFKSFIF